MGIAYRRFQILALVIEHLLDLLLQLGFLRAHLGAQRKKRTTQHAAALSLDFRLETVAELAILPQALQRWNSWREERVKFRPPPFPFLIESCYCQVRFRIKKVIKTPLFDARLCADIVDSRAAV